MINKKIADINKVDQWQKSLDFNFKNLDLLQQALTHRSYLNESGRKTRTLEANERLEFLGDAILDFVVSAWLFKELPKWLEGGLTNLRSGLVKTENLADVANQIKLGNYLLLGKGEKETGGQKNRHLLANTLEAIIGALFIDQGLQASRKFIRSHFQATFKKLIESEKLKDYKSLLQENLQAKTKETPIYKTINEDGPDHQKKFAVGVFFQNKLIGKGEGKSKQEAQQEAAKLALHQLNKN